MRQMKDPAPSRLSYRLQRWMLTPGIRFGLRFGLPFAVVFAGASVWLSDPERRAGLNEFVADIRASIEERPEFMVSLMAIDGASPDLAEEIRETLPIDLPESSFDLDLEALRARIVGMAPVKSAAVRIRPGGILQVDVTERAPVFVWRSDEGVRLIDEKGVIIAQLPSRRLRPDLPLIAGKGASDHVAEAKALFAAATPLGDRLRGLVRVGERRWDVVLDRGQRILLPEVQPVRALERVIALSAAQEMLDRDVAVVDMRLRSRPTLRMTQAAYEEWWKIRKINGNGQ